MRMNAKLLSLFTAGLFLTACETPLPPSSNAGSTYVMPNTPGKGTYNVLLGGKKGVSFEATDLDILSENTNWCCDDGRPKEAAILRSSRELEIKVGDLTPNIRLDDIEVSCVWDNDGVLIVDYTFIVAHAGGVSRSLPVVEVPVFLTAMDIPSGEVYSNMNAMIKVDLNRPFDEQSARVRFDANDLKARNLSGWSFVTGLMKSEMNRKFEQGLARERELKIAETGSKEVNETRTGPIAPAKRYSEDYAWRNRDDNSLTR